MVATFKGIAIGVVMLILVVILCQTILPTYLPTDGSLDFLGTIIPLAVGFGVVIYAVAGMFRSHSGDEF